MRAVFAALRSPSYWRYGFSKTRAITALLSSFGGLWLMVNTTNFFSPTAGNWLRGQWMWFLGLGLVFAAWQNLPRVRFECRLKGRDVVLEIRVGDMFKLPGAFVIGSNTSFDTDVASGLISRRSVQGQFTTTYYDSVGHLDSDLLAALNGIPPERTSPGKRGKQTIYKVGTTVHVLIKETRAYFVGLATMNDNGVAQGTFDDLQVSLPMLWEYIATKGGDFEPIVIPVMGSGFTRLSQTREELIRAIVDSFVAACASSRPTEKLTVVIPYKDFYQHQVDLLELERYVQHVCKYTEHREPTAVGVGTAVV
jgi:hypothetical protein